MNSNSIPRPIAVLFATPSYDAKVYTGFFESMLKTIIILKHHNIEADLMFLPGDSLIPRARNNLVAKFLSFKKFSHLMFIDSDIIWHPNAILRLLQNDKDLVGAAYPKKKILWKRLANIKGHLPNKKQKHNENLDETEFLKHHMIDYNFNVKDDSIEQVKVENTVIKVKHIATGFMLMKREMLEKMCKEYPKLKYVDDVGALTEAEQKNAYALFNCEIDEKGHFLSEDWLFCDRWRKIGGEVYIDFTIGLTHMGIHPFEGRLLTILTMSEMNKKNKKSSVTIKDVSTIST